VIIVRIAMNVLPENQKEVMQTLLSMRDKEPFMRTIENSNLYCLRF
jgi:hypothetical protein